MTDDDRMALAAWLGEWHADPRSGDQSWGREVWVALMFAHLDQARAGDSRQYAEQRVIPFILNVLATLEAGDIEEWEAKLVAHVRGD